MNLRTTKINGITVILNLGSAWPDPYLGYAYYGYIPLDDGTFHEISATDDDILHLFMEPDGSPRLVVPGDPYYPALDAEWEQHESE